MTTYLTLKQRLGTGAVLALIGPRGTGKTQLGCDLICEATTGRGMSARYAKAIEFFMGIKATFQRNAEETEKAVIDRFRRPALLVLDEISSRGETEWEDRLFDHLIDERYGAKKDTILIGNFVTVRDFDASVGPSIASRLSETGGVIDCNWASFRNPSPQTDRSSRPGS